MESPAGMDLFPEIPSIPMIMMTSRLHSDTHRGHISAAQPMKATYKKTSDDRMISSRAASGERALAMTKGGCLFPPFSA